MPDRGARAIRAISEDDVTRLMAVGLLGGVGMGFRNLVPASTASGRIETSGERHTPRGSDQLARWQGRW